jgi:hypothetical protein
LPLTVSIILSFTVIACSGPSGTTVATVPATQQPTITSKSALDAYMQSPAFASSPLQALPNAARDHFLSSLSFNEKGVTGFNYSDLHSDLTVTQVYQILRLFGAQADTALVGGQSRTAQDRALLSETGIPNTDHPGYECVSRANCYPAANFICMSDC